MGCPRLWCSRLQTEIFLITTEEEYIALRQKMHDVITFMVQIKEISFIIDIHNTDPEVFCNVFEYNQSCIAVTE